MHKQTISRKDFYKSLDINEEILVPIIDVDECNSHILYFTEYNGDMYVILKHYKSSYSQVHKDLLVQALTMCNPSLLGYEYIAENSTFDIIDLLSILPVSFYESFVIYLLTNRVEINGCLSGDNRNSINNNANINGINTNINTNNMYNKKRDLLEIISEYPQVIEIFTKEYIWDIYTSHKESILYTGDITTYNVDSVESTLKKLIVSSTKIKDLFRKYLDKLIERNKERNKFMFNTKLCLTHNQVLNINKLINKFMKPIMKDGMFEKRLLQDDIKPSFVEFIFYIKLEIFKFTFIKFIEHRRRLLVERESTEEMDNLILNIVEEKEYGEYIIRVLGYLKNSEEGKDGTSTLCINITSDTSTTNPSISIPTTDSYIPKTPKVYDLLMVYLHIRECIPLNGEDLLSRAYKYKTLRNNVLRVLCKEPNNIKFSLLNLIIDHYNQIQKEDIKYETRHLINYILNGNKSFRILRICKRNIKFINCMMSDLEYMLSGALTGIMDLNILMDELYKLISTKNLINVKEKYSNIINLRRKIEQYFLFVETSFKLLIHIVDCRVEIILVPELINIFVKILNCNLNIILGKECRNLIVNNPFNQINNMNNNLNINSINDNININNNSAHIRILKEISKESLNFKPKELLRNILLVYIGIPDTKFIKHVGTEEMYFDIEIFKKGYEIAENKYLLNTNQLNTFRKLIKELEKYDGFVEEEEEGEFIDPLTYINIKDPVRLLTSNITVDRSTYNMIMLNDGIDPFNRQPLDDTKVVIDEEMLKKINKEE